MAPNITHLTFDFFGTLVAYKPGHFAGNKKYKKSFDILKENQFLYDYELFVTDYADIFNKLTEQSLLTFKEFHMDEVTKTFMKKNTLKLSKQAQDHFTKTYLNEWNTNVIHYPKIQEFINRLNMKYSLSIISNTHYTPLVLNNLKNMGIDDAFDVIVTSVDHGFLKPHPSIFTDTLNSLHASPSQTVHIGDSYNDDFIGAQNAGIRCFLIDSERKYEGIVEDRVSSLFEIESLLVNQST